MAFQDDLVRLLVSDDGFTISKSMFDVSLEFINIISYA